MKKYRQLLTFMFLMTVLTSNSAFSQAENEREPVEHEDSFWNTVYKYFYKDKPSSMNESHHFKGFYRAINLSGLWKFQIGDNKKWMHNEFSDEDWEKIEVPEDWENEGFNGYDGYAWYRIHFDGRDLNPKHAHYLILGFIDDVDETYLNGRMVGKTGKFPPRFRTAYNSNRKYYVSNEIINFDGDNVIAVKVYDEYKNGGIVKGYPGIYVSRDSEDLLQNLYGPWKFTRHNNKDFSDLDYDDEHWEVLMVPAFWDNQGYRSFNGTAWYRKTFKLNFIPNPHEDYYLVLGRIDDFDRTYLNGEFIGETNDYLPFGQSQSYRTIRVYKIPSGLLDIKKDNVIAVKVKDIGIDGGIYSGPIGIISENEITRIVRQYD